MRYTPFEDVERLFERFPRSVDAVVGPRLDVMEGDDELVVVADLPGFETDDIDVSVSGRTLTLRAEREAETEREDGAWLRRERSSSSVRRSVDLPAAVDVDDATATYTNGVLTVTLPRADGGADDGHHIAVE